MLWQIALVGVPTLTNSAQHLNITYSFVFLYGLWTIFKSEHVDPNAPSFEEVSVCGKHTTVQHMATNLGIHSQRLRQRQPNKKQVGSAEGQGEQRWRLVEDTFSHFGADGKVGSQQGPHSEAQREGNTDHGLETIDSCLDEVGI